MSTSLKGPFGKLIAGLALSLASFLGAVLPPVAEAQDTGWASTQEAQQKNTDSTNNTADAPASSQRPVGEAPAKLVVEPGDTLWAIGQERLGAGATPGRIAQEVERIYELNQGRMGDDPNLLFPGQELWLAAPAAEAPAAPQPAAPEPVATAPVAERSGGEPTMADFQAVPGSIAPTPVVLPEEEPSSSVIEPAADAPEEQPADQPPAEQQPVDEEPAGGRPAAVGSDAEQAGEPSTLPGASSASRDQEDAPAAEAPREPDNAQARRLLGFGILALVLLLAIVAAWRLPMRREVEDPRVWGTPRTLANHNGHPHGTNVRGEARGPAVPASAEFAPNPVYPRDQRFANRPYVDRTAMVVGAGVGRRGAKSRGPRRFERTTRKDSRRTRMLPRRTKEG